MKTEKDIDKILRPPLFMDHPLTAQFFMGHPLVAAFKITDETRLPCMAHRCNSALEIAWDETIKTHKDFQIFCTCVKDLRKFINQTIVEYKINYQNQLKVIVELVHGDLILKCIIH
jgi:hypothetical protein